MPKDKELVQKGDAMCDFCKIARHEINANIVYEDEGIMAFMDYAPINEGHILIIPKEHMLDIDEIPDKVLYSLLDLSKRIVSALKKTYSPEGYTIMQNGGEFNDLGHYHLHVFPRYKNDGFGWTDSGKQYDCSMEIALKIKENL